MTEPRYVVGIDLGTTNSAIAYADLRAPDPAATLAHLPVPQLVAPGETATRRLLSSSAYLPSEHELPPGALKLPWGEADVIVGELARREGARVPGRLVTSAKSWLHHGGVDRTAAILPWGAPEGVARRSPVEASALYLAHLRAAWDHAFPAAPLAEQDVVLTVPASFDEVARELTVQAARSAGIPKLRLLEEPQAAFYAWTAAHRAGLGEALGTRRLVLVVDVGGGTTDFSLIAVKLAGGMPALERIAVGDHILLGGDNMDATLARQVEARLGQRLDAARWGTLVASCRAAKETLLGPLGPSEVRLAIAGGGSRLVGGTLAADLERDAVLAQVLDGFFPHVAADAEPQRAARGGLTELGLPYAADPAVTRHVAAFLRRHAPEAARALGTAGALPRPDAVLLNGGVFTPRIVADRLLEAVSAWFPDRPPVAELASPDLDLAVARGAAFYGLVRRGFGLRIGGGTARAYFVGVAGGQAVCVIPRRLEEDVEVEVPRTFTLTLDRPVQFPLWASSTVLVEAPGEVVPLGDELRPLPPIRTVLRSGKQTTKAATAVEVPAKLRAVLTEIGTLALWCESGAEKWKLEFQLHGGRGHDVGASAVEPMSARFAEARAQVELFFGRKPVAVDPGDVKGLVRSLEKILGPRPGWTTPVIRELWGALHAGQQKRRRSPEHERVWCQLTGYCLRPGFGAPLDGWRAAENWKVFVEGLEFHQQPRSWEQWWVLWRRIAGGLEKEPQERLFSLGTPILEALAAGRTPSTIHAARAEAIPELVRLLASLERLAADHKVRLGNAVLALMAREGAHPQHTWAIGRIGARVPFYGSAHACAPVPAAESWIGRLLAWKDVRPEALAFPLAQLARATGDRARDVDEAVRGRVVDFLTRTGAADDLARSVREVAVMDAANEQRVFGESLPPGLTLDEG